VTPYIDYYFNLIISLLKKPKVLNAARYRKKRDDDYQKTQNRFDLRTENMN